MQALYRLSTDNVRLDDLIHVGFGDKSVPNRFGINDDGRAVLALIEAAGLVRADSPFQSTLREFLLEQLLQLAFGQRVAASAGILRWTLVSTYENMFFKFRHRYIFADFA